MDDARKAYWKHRIDMVAFHRDGTLYVTADELREISNGEATITHLAPFNYASGGGRIGEFFGTPVVVDPISAAHQKSRHEIRENRIEVTVTRPKP